MIDPVDIADVYREAHELHQTGNLDEAERLYKVILDNDPNHAAVLEALGRICLQRGRWEEAMQMIGLSLAIDANQPHALNNLGIILHKLERLDEALFSYERAIELKPDYAVAYCNRGNTLQQLKRFDAALASHNKAIALKPEFAEAHSNRGNVLREIKRLYEALSSYDKAIALKPSYAEAYNNRGNVLGELKRYYEALFSYDRAIALKPDYAEAFNHRGTVLSKLKRHYEALLSCERAIALKPDYAEAFNNRGGILGALGRFDEALLSHDEAIALKPDYAEAYSNRGNVLAELKRLDEALASHDKAIALEPEVAESYWNRSLSHLLSGNLEVGWRDYEWRKKKQEPDGNRTFPQPGLPGKEYISGRKILVYSEQGLGDTIQFCRYIRSLNEAGAKPLFAPQIKLKRLMKSLDADFDMVEVEDKSLEFDFHCPLLSLPFVLNTNIETVPNQVPYLHAESERIDYWAGEIGLHGFKIGICWQGAIREIDMGRSFPVAEFLRISKIPDVRLINLHLGAGISQLENLPSGMNVEVLGEAFDAGPDAFLDTAAVIKLCDLVITSDTAVAHLAGALGATTWVALKQVPDWRWMLDRPDSPWYPGMRLFRQPVRDDWQSVFLEIEKELRVITG